MLIDCQGDILQAEAEGLVNPVNCVGVMGAGLALQFKQAFPENYRAYAAACRRGEVALGRVFVFTHDDRDGAPGLIINFPTKRHWRNKSRLDDIQAGLNDLKQALGARQVRSVAVPALGSGLGGLAWKDVRERIVETLGSIEGLTVLLYGPDGPRPVPDPGWPSSRR